MFSLYKQVIDVFPKPSGAKGELALLLKVYKTIEEKEPTMLDKMYPIVGRYMKVRLYFISSVSNYCCSGASKSRSTIK